MFKRTVSTEDLTRLKQEREDADGQYNGALTALDQALQRLRELPHPPPAYDKHQITPLNERWDLLAVRPSATGWRSRLQALVWRSVGPLFERQHAFNSTLVDHLNRNVSIHREVAAATTGALVVLREELANSAGFQSRLIGYVQSLTPYIDTKDREVAGLMRRINEDVAEIVFHLDHRIAGLAGTLSDVSDELHKRSESMTARERRYDARERALAAQVEDLRGSFAVVSQVAQTLKRELEHLLDSKTPASGDRPSAVAVTAALDSHKYVGFEDLYRGSTEDIRSRLTAYVEDFAGTSDVLDVGCGRGEFLELLREHGIAARGIDTNHEMVEVCKRRGLVCDEDDALGFLNRLPDAALGGFFSAQVVEHLEPSYLIRLLDTAYLKLRPGAKLILETINAASWSAFFHSYIRDITHVQALHPDTLRYLVSASGFQNVQVRYLSPYPDDFKLKAVQLPASSPDAASSATTLGVLMTFNENVEKLNRLLFAEQDYAVIAERH